MKASSPSTQLELSLEALAQRIKAREIQIDESAERAIQAAADTVRLAIEQGEDLLLAKTKVKHGGWEDWLEKNFSKSDRRARDYMMLAAEAQRRGLEFFKDARTIEGAFRLLGLLPAIQRPEVQQQLANISIRPIVQKVNLILEFITRERDVIETFTPEEKLEFKQRLRPIVDLYQKLES